MARGMWLSSLAHGSRDVWQRLFTLLQTVSREPYWILGPDYNVRNSALAIYFGQLGIPTEGFTVFQNTSWGTNIQTMIWLGSPDSNHNTNYYWWKLSPMVCISGENTWYHALELVSQIIVSLVLLSLVLAWRILFQNFMK